LTNQQPLKKLFYEVEMPIVFVLSAMEQKGVKINEEWLKQYSIELEERLKKIENEIYDLTQMHFNIDSPKQLGEVLFNHLKIVDKPKKTKTGQYATGEEVLTQLSDKHPVIDKILEYRMLKKLKTTYVDALPTYINPHTGRIHTSFMQAVTATGRLSSNNPNLQNIPIKTEEGKKLRSVFVPENKNQWILSADYSQIELRIIASLSGEENMIADFLAGKDIHAATAARVFGVAESKVTREMRSKAKAVNFGIIYGQTPFGLSQALNISKTEAKEIIDQYFEKYPRIKEYMDKMIAFARENGYVETVLGRRRYLRDINSGNSVVRGFAERNAINSPIQGSAADIIKLAMINIFHKIQEEKLKSSMILQVHDELVFEVEDEELVTMKKLVKHEMENAYQLKVPLVVDVGVGKNWLEAH
jgi:DNA polymerase-1